MSTRKVFLSISVLIVIALMTWSHFTLLRINAVSNDIKAIAKQQDYYVCKFSVEGLVMASTNSKESCDKLATTWYTENKAMIDEIKKSPFTKILVEQQKDIQELQEEVRKRRWRK